jgi:FkbM family methyltransferase
MLNLDTATKIQIGRALYYTVRAMRRITGSTTDQARCRRQGLNWELDLSEGIDLSLFVFGAFDRPADRAIRRWLRPGMVALDIGANVGGHALPMADLVGPSGRVYAFEPTGWAFDRLKRNLALNPSLAPVLTPIHAAMVGRNDPPAPSYYSSWNFVDRGEVHEVHRGALRSVGDARFVTLDEMVAELALEGVDFIKLDVDGFEVGVLEGGATALRRFRPPILFELCPHSQEEVGGSAVALLRRICSLGYEIVDLEGKPFEVTEAFIDRRVPKWGSINLLATAT